ncbi:class I SAM-dependent methyltransferase [Paraconexibacter antarcticus]|uniref:Ribosomal RNA small subunit methyltransferase G n=1 Tax=Paraconexibacter antarcticus TaxID=2949664 RepID=A0ABY5DUK8_9ACTN|nr:16S rRNA (guanine(527)-N(7))-methyltransferase RsmG [Paraconexibacter antarcticus]UTI64604.1 class I SAM-dependent methyltransferase [Paraconexibacter antarcticus]
MNPVDSRLAELCAAHGLDAALVPRFRALLDGLAADPTAPTTVVDPTAAVEVHVADSLDGLGLPLVREARVVADIGAGAGFPGLVLALCLPGAQVSLVESVGRKCEFMGRLAAVAGVTNALPVHARAEAWPAGIGAHDLVTARALAPLTALVEYAAPLLAEDGHLVAWKGARDTAEEADGAAAAAATGMELVEVWPVPPRPGADRRHLHVFRKAEPTPSRFPRREGMARKRPITAA